MGFCCSSFGGRGEAFRSNFTGGAPIYMILNHDVVVVSGAAPVFMTD